jgi:hypothetical protein
MTLWLPEKKGERLFRVVQLDGTEDIVSARSHTAAKLKAAKFGIPTNCQWFHIPAVKSCRLVKGVY